MRKTIIKKVPVKPEKMAIIHDCTKEAVIDGISQKVDLLGVFLTGNGSPENGLLRKVAIIGERQHEVLTKIEEIHGSLKEYHTETEEAKSVAITASHALEEYRAVLKTAEETKEKEKQERRSRLLKNIEVISCIVGALGLLVTAYFSITGSRQSHTNYKATMQNSSQLKKIENTVGIDTVSKKDTLKMQ